MPRKRGIEGLGRFGLDHRCCSAKAFTFPSNRDDDVHRPLNLESAASEFCDVHTAGPGTAQRRFKKAFAKMQLFYLFCT